VAEKALESMVDRPSEMAQAMRIEGNEPRKPRR